MTELNRASMICGSLPQAAQTHPIFQYAWTTSLAWPIIFLIPDEGAKSPESAAVSPSRQSPIP